MPPATPSHYYVEMHCNNCGHDGQFPVKKGELKPKKTTCLSCECETYIPVTVNKRGGGPPTEPRRTNLLKP